MTGRRFHRTMEMIPALFWKPKSPSVSTPSIQRRKQGDAGGASEVRRGTSSIHFHCPLPRSSSHIGHGVLHWDGQRPRTGSFSFLGEAAAANGGVTNWGLRGVCPPSLEIGRNRPFSPFFCHFRPFSEGPRST